MSAVEVFGSRGHLPGRAVAGDWLAVAAAFRAAAEACQPRRQRGRPGEALWLVLHHHLYLSHDVV